MMAVPKSLIINSAYERPDRHWRQVRDNTLSIVDDRGIESLKIISLEAESCTRQ